MSEQKDYIERGAFIDFIDAGHLRYATEKVFSENDLVKMISEQPASAVRPDVQGEWIFRNCGSYSQTRAFCSACGKHSGIGGIRSNQAKPFCPNCGAHMIGAGNVDK